MRPHLDEVGLWPFDGSIQDLLLAHDIVLVETYPGDAYGQLGIPSRPIWSKRKQEDRARVSGPLLDSIARHGSAHKAPVT